MQLYIQICGEIFLVELQVIFMQVNANKYNQTNEYQRIGDRGCEVPTPDNP